VAADWARRSEDQGQENNLVEKTLGDATARLGAGSIVVLSDQPLELFEDSSTGTDSIPNL
jgi:hypothetical protein